MPEIFEMPIFRFQNQMGKMEHLKYFEYESEYESGVFRVKTT